MGVDACIYFKTRHGDEPSMCDPLPPGCSVVTASKWSCEGATHEVDQPWRYYGPGYERGPWPSIAAVLMALLASPNVETVWYFGDCSDGDEPFTPQRVLEFSAHYMAEGDRPYRGAYPAAHPADGLDPNDNIDPDDLVGQFASAYLAWNSSPMENDVRERYRNALAALYAALASAPQASQPPQGADKRVCSNCNGSGVVGIPGAPCPFCKLESLAWQWEPSPEEALAEYDAALAAPPQGASIKRSEWESLSPEARKLLHDRTRDYVLRQGQAATEVRDKPLAASPQGAPLPDHDNHHNALKCPYCNPNRWVLVPPDAASPLPAPQEPADPEWSRERIEAAAFSLGMRYAAPAPVDPESQGSSEPRLSDRDLIDRFDL